MDSVNYYDPYKRTYEPEGGEPYNPEYAGFLVRFIAFFIDSIILGVTMMICIVPFTLVMAYADDISGATGGTGSDGSGIFCCAYCLVYIVGLIVQWLYFAWFESSASMATPGKMLLGLQVTDESGDRISFSKATLRLVAKIVSNSFFYIGSLAIPFTSKKQGLYDMIAGTYVVKK